MTPMDRTIDVGPVHTGARDDDGEWVCADTCPHPDHVAEHVSEIMFDSMSSPDPDCSLCKRGIELGVWARYGVTDPFAPEDDA